MPQWTGVAQTQIGTAPLTAAINGRFLEPRDKGSSAKRSS